MTPGRLLARGTMRHLSERHFACLDEVLVPGGLRVDIIALGPKGDIWVIECKSSRADFVADRKWRGYLDFCDRFFWAVNEDFPRDLLPEDTGIIIADGYDAELLRMAPESRMASARRKAMTLRIARCGLLRLHATLDPQGPSAS